jgi:hypothetical protein
MGKTRFHKKWPLSYAGDSHLQHNKEAAGKLFQHTCLLVLRFFCNIKVKVEVKAKVKVKARLSYFTSTKSAPRGGKVKNSRYRKS